MSEVEPSKRPKRAVARRHVPQVIVPVAPDQVRKFVRDALKGTSIMNPAARYMSGWEFFAPRIRFTPVDATHTLIELDVVGTVRGSEIWLYSQRRGEIDRFFVAIQDELDRRHRWDPRPPSGEASIESGD